MNMHFKLKGRLRNQRKISRPLVSFRPKGTNWLKSTSKQQSDTLAPICLAFWLDTNSNGFHSCPITTQLRSSLRCIIFLHRTNRFILNKCDVNSWIIFKLVITELLRAYVASSLFLLTWCKNKWFLF